jgi:hypothetical protein
MDISDAAAAQLGMVLGETSEGMPVPPICASLFELTQNLLHATTIGLSVPIQRLLIEACQVI